MRTIRISIVPKRTLLPGDVLLKFLEDRFLKSCALINVINYFIKLEQIIEASLAYEIPLLRAEEYLYRIIHYHPLE